MVTFGAMVSSRKYVVRVMAVDDMAVVEKSGTDLFSHSWRNSSGGVIPLVTMKQKTSSAATSRTGFPSSSGGYGFGAAARPSVGGWDPAVGFVSGLGGGAQLSPLAGSARRVIVIPSAYAGGSLSPL